MDLQVVGKCVKVFNTEYTAKKDGQVHNKHHFVLEFQDGQWVRRLCLSVMDDERWQKMGVVEGATYSVSFDVSSREYNGKYYTEASAWRAFRVDGNGNNNQAQAQQPAPAQPQPQNDNNVPF